MKNDFNLFATSKCGISGTTIDKVNKSNNLILPQSYINPTILEERQLNVTQMDVFSRLMADRIIFLGTEIDDTVANVVIAQLLYLSSQDPEAPITMYLNTPGGSVYSGMAIYDTMQYVKPDVSTICIGMAASMGAFLLSCGAKGKRFALPNAEIMIHQPLGGFKGQATDIDIHAKRILKIKEKLNLILSENTNQDIEKLKRDVERDYFMEADEAKEYGIVDEVIVRHGK